MFMKRGRFGSIAATGNCSQMQQLLFDCIAEGPHSTCIAENVPWKYWWEVCSSLGEREQQLCCLCITFNFGSLQCWYCQLDMATAHHSSSFWISSYCSFHCWLTEGHCKWHLPNEFVTELWSIDEWLSAFIPGHLMVEKLQDWKGCASVHAIVCALDV